MERLSLFPHHCADTQYDCIKSVLFRLWREPRVLVLRYNIQSCLMVSVCTVAFNPPGQKVPYLETYQQRLSEVWEIRLMGEGMVTWFLIDLGWEDKKRSPFEASQPTSSALKHQTPEHQILKHSAAGIPIKCSGCVSLVLVAVYTGPVRIVPGPANAWCHTSSNSMSLALIQLSLWSKNHDRGLFECFYRGLVAPFRCQLSYGCFIPYSIYGLNDSFRTLITDPLVNMHSHRSVTDQPQYL